MSITAGCSSGAMESLRLYINEVKDGDFCDTKEDNVITCAEFDDSGEYLAAGDRAGRIYVFNGSGQEPVYSMFCAFTSHESEFDYLKSLEIEEKINALCFLPICNNSLQLLATNDKVIKLWRMSEQSPFAYNFNFRRDEGEIQSDDEGGAVSEASSSTDPLPSTESINNNSSLRSAISFSSLRVPRYRKRKNLTIEVRSRKIYANAHTYHINSLALNSDQETFLSADDLRINLWHLNHTNQSFMIVDIKPENMEDLNEVITCARFHPELCNLLGYTTSRGIVRLCDMRAGALCDNHVLSLNDPSLNHDRSFFCDIISSLSDFRFDHSRNYVLARDYLNLKVWDVRKGDRPCEVYSVHEPMRSQLVNLYESDAIFDKFLCSWSEDDRYVFTGSYGNVLRIFDRHLGSDWIYDLGEPGIRPPKPIITSKNVNVPFLSLTPGKPFFYPNRPRLLPKCYITPESEVASRFHLQNICLANASALNALNSTPSISSKIENSSATSPVIAGSKRRKQTLHPLRKSPEEIEEDNTNSDGDVEDDDDGDDDDEEDSDDLNEDHVDGVHHYRSHRSHRRLNGKPSPTAVKSHLSGLREVDFKRRFLQVAWHPRRPLLVTVSGKEMFFISGKKTTSEDDSESENSEVEAVKLQGVERSRCVIQDTFLISPLDIKAAKRPRRREGEVDIKVPELPTISKEDAKAINRTTDEDRALEDTNKMELE